MSERALGVSARGRRRLGRPFLFEKKMKTEQEFSVSKKILQRLGSDFNVNLDDLDDKTKESLIAMHNPSKYTLAHKILDYVGWVLILIALIALFRFHWITFVFSLVLGFVFLFSGFVVQRNNAQRALKIYRKRLIHQQVANEALFSEEFWKAITELLRVKRPLLASMLVAGKIKVRKVYNNTLILTGNKECFRYLRNPADSRSLSEIIKEVTGKEYKIYYL